MTVPQGVPPIPGFDKVHNVLQNLRMIMGYKDKDGKPPAGKFDLPTRKPVVTSYENFDRFSHDEILAKNQAITPEQIEAIRATWQQSAETLNELYLTFNNKIAKAISGKWQSGAGDAAAQAVGDYVQRSAQLIESAYAMASRTNSLGHAMAQTKSSIPSVPAPSSNLEVVGSWLPGSHWRTTQEKREAARKQAVDVMERVYRDDGVRPAATSIPTMPSAQGPTTGNGGLSAPTGGGGGGGFGRGGAGGVQLVGAGSEPGGSDGEAGRNPQSGGGSEVAPAGDGAAAQPAAASSGDSSDSGEATSAAGYQPNPAMGVPGGGHGSGVGGSIGGGVSSGHGGGFGGGVLATPVAGGGDSATGGAGSAARPAAAGRSGMPGMGAPGAAGKKDGEKEHETAEYLRGRRNGEELLEETNGRKVLPAGGVIGVWDDDGRPVS